jgi:hypothetical protein
MSHADAIRNLGLKAARRMGSLHKPFVRMMRRQTRRDERAVCVREAEAIDREIARVASGDGPIIAGPWLAEVGYEVLYWIPFLRWFQDAYRIPPERIVAVSRGGMDTAYSQTAGTYVDLFDVVSPDAFSERNARRQAEAEGGGRKQSGGTAFDHELLTAVRARVGIGDAAVCHPALMFRLFRHVWHGNLPYDLLWRHTRHLVSRPPGGPQSALETADLPDDFIAVKLYIGPAVSGRADTRRSIQAIVRRAASIAPVVLLDTGLALDDHRDVELDLPDRAITARAMMTPRANLGVQIDLIARSRFFLGSCGGLAWLAPFLGVPTVAVYDDDRLLAPHLLTIRLAAAAAGAAEFAPLDLRALARAGLGRAWDADRAALAAGLE